MTRPRAHRRNFSPGIFALLLLVALPASGQYFGKNRIQYRDFDWEIYHSPHFNVYYYKSEEPLLQKAVSFAESAYDELSRVFDHQIQEPTPLIIYQTHSAFLQNNIILNGIPEGAQAFASPVRFRMVLPLDLPDRELLALIKHELTHIFQYHILFRGRLGAGLRSNPPTWFIEGMASYMADDEGPSDRKFMIDAVVNDNLPSVETPFGGFFAYRYGNAVFTFIEERWGKEAVLDLIYEFRNTIGSRVGKAIERTFRMDVEDFDSEFRRWARQKYLPELLRTGEPGDFGRPFRLENDRAGQELSPAASPSGDLVAAVTTDKGEIDISLFDARNRRRLRNLTSGIDTEIREIVVQLFSAGRQVGGDLAFSPDGNTLAAFGRREAGRSLILIDVLKGGLEKIIDMEVEQQLSPAWTRDGKYVAFSGNYGGYFDIFLVDVDTLEIINLTADENYDAAPAFSPDGKFMAYTSYVGEYAQLFLLDLNDPTKRYQLTFDESHNKEPVFSPSGRRIYFTSDRSGIDNIYGLDLDRKEVTQYTNAVTGCDRPAVLPLADGGERLVYTGFWKSNFDLYMTDVEEPLTAPVPVDLPGEPTEMAALERFEPAIEVSIDENNVDDYGGFKFFLEDAQNFIGIDSNQFFVGRVLLSFSDFLGDRRIFVDVAAVDSFSDFQVTYLNQRRRWQWAAQVFQTRLFYTFEEFDGSISRDEAFSLTGAEYIWIYPFSFNNRVELRGGYFLRDYKQAFFVLDEQGLPDIEVIPVREDDYPQIGAALVSDNTTYNQWGPISGHRVRLSAAYAADLKESGTLANTYSLDARQYFPLTRRSNLAFRAYGAISDGNFPNIFFVGGLDTVRGFNFREFVGTRAFFANAELRFPLIDQLAFPFLRFEGIRGVIFFDIGAAYFPEENFDFYDSDNDRLDGGVAAYGWGFTARLFGLNLNWDFAQVTDLDETADSFETSFWIGTRF